jgi:hypothetical protein
MQIHNLLREILSLTNSPNNCTMTFWHPPYFISTWNAESGGKNSETIEIVLLWDYDMFVSSPCAFNEFPVLTKFFIYIKLVDEILLTEKIRILIYHCFLEKVRHRTWTQPFWQERSIAVVVLKKKGMIPVVISKVFSCNKTCIVAVEKDLRALKRHWWNRSVFNVV